MSYILSDKVFGRRYQSPLGMSYNDSYKKAYPFNKLIDGMLGRQMIRETVEILLAAIGKEVEISLIVNNRAGGNAPLIVRKISEHFLEQQNLMNS